MTTFPWELQESNLLKHVPLPAKVSVQVLASIDLRARPGSKPGLEESYDHVVGVMQQALDDLAARGADCRPLREGR